MSVWSDPPRLLEGTALSDEDRRALSAYAGDAPGAERRARILEGLSRERTIESAGASSTARWGTGKLKLVLVSAGLLASVIGLPLLWPRHAARPLPRAQSAAELVAPPSLAAAVLVVPPPAAEPAVEAALPASTLPGPSVTAEQPQSLAGQRERSKPKRRRSSLVAPAGPAGTDLRLPLEPETASRERGSDPVAELTLLARARRALLVRPAHALEFTEAHARDFPHGTFGEEREVLAIEALLRIGLDDEAKQRAMAFGQHYPNSAHRAHLARMIHPLDP